MSRRSLQIFSGIFIGAVFTLTVCGQANKLQEEPENPWTEIGALPSNRPVQVMGIRAGKFKALDLNHGQLRKLLDSAPNEKAQAVRMSPAQIRLPMPDGSFARFRFVESPVMESGLAAKFPEIKTFAGQGIDDPEATVRFDLTPAGFHAQILSPSGAVYIDPAFRGENGLHTAYYKHDYSRAEDFHCLFDGNSPTAGRGAGQGGGLAPLLPAALARSGGNLRTYRLACAATAEYTAYHGGTVAAGLAAIVTAINRVTGVYETEVAIRLVLVANNDLVVYTNASTDPYSNGTPSSLLTQNQSTLDSVIGSGNYDIGHVFSTAGGGLAGLGVVCIAGQKARGETGTSAPIGDAFYIDYVAHEMGHQFGGNHTFNSSASNCGGGNRNAATAYEQGSGSTIMAYAGICGSDNLQLHSDPYFHSISFDEILNYSTGGSGNNCAVLTSTGNNAPTVSAGPNYTIPQNTAFTLTATGSDPDGDPLTFDWEERDLGVSTTVSAADNGSSPIFRSWNPTTSPSRIFPRLQDLLNNTLAIGEVMPTTTRTMNFRVTARDNRAGGGGVNTADMQVNVTTSSGPFLVTSHNSGGTFSGLQTVTWNVAGTTNAPVSAANVNILLSTNGGQTFPITLASNTPNDGSQSLVLPNINTTTARIKVQAAGNIFFDVGNANFTIVPGIPTPAISLETALLTAENCSAPNNAIDPGETVTLNIALKNTGSGDTTNLVATLLSGNGVTLPSSPQNYGVLAAGGASVNRSFSLTATGACGGSITAVLQLQDGPVNLGTVTSVLGLGATTLTVSSTTNGSVITIPQASSSNGAGIASPYPSALTVSGLAGSVSKVTVTLRGLSHSWPDDLDILLVGPGGQKTMLMSDAGGSAPVNNVTLTFDDSASQSLPDSSQISAGTYKPTDFQAGETMTAPAPAGPYSQTLSVFKGQNPNGNWSLYVVDDSSQDIGSLAQGWVLSVTTSNSSCCVATTPFADLVLRKTASASLLNVGSNLTFTLSVTNLGPDNASSVTVTDALPAGISFVSATSSIGTCTNVGGTISCALGTMTSNAVATISVQAIAATAGNFTNVATASAVTPDPIPANNSATVAVSVNAIPFISSVTDQTTNEDNVIGPLGFTIGDLETPAASLSVTTSSSDTNLLPLANVVLGGGGSNRTVTLTPAPNLSGSATVTLTVSDGLASASSSFVVTVNPVNDPPVLAGISNYTIFEGETLTFTNVASDIEAPFETLTFSLENAPTNATINPTNGVFSWTPTEAQGPGTNVISVIVTDNGVPSLTATQIFTVVVLETNSAPVLSPIPNFIVAEGDTLTITNVATDPDLPANGLLFSLANAPTNSTINPTNGVFSWTTTEADGPGTNLIQVIVTDNGVPSLSATQSFTVIVRETNAPPSLAPITNYTIVEGETLTFTNSATDPDHGLNQLTFSLANPPAGASVGVTNGVFTWTPDESQGGSTNLISVIVTDDGVPSMSATQSFTVVVLEKNSAPVLAGISNYTIFEGQTLTFTNAFSDSDLPPNLLTFRLENAPTNATINPTNGVFTWTPDESQGGTSNYFSVVLTDDGVPSLSITQSFAVMVLDTNSAPLLGAISNYTIFEGQTLTITNAASDSDIPANMLVFSLQNAPTNATINPTSGVFTWTPDEAQGPSTNFISVVVADDGLPSLTATQSFTVIVLETNSAPVLAAIADFKVQVGNTLVFTNSASDSDLPANILAYSLDPGAPLSASVGAGTGIFAWTPTDADAGTAQSVTVRVTDDGAPALFDTKTFLVSVVSRPFITSIVVNSNFVAVTWTALAGQGYRLQFNTNLAETNWVDVLPDVIASAPSATQTNAFNAAASHFYRVRLVP